MGGTTAGLVGGLRGIFNVVVICDECILTSTS